MKYALLLALLALAFSAGRSPAQQTVLPRVTPEQAGLDSAELRKASALLRDFVRQRKIPGAVAMVARDGKIGYIEAVGVQDLGTQSPMTERTVFRVYSMAKSVTAVAAMMLYEQGAFELDDPVSNYLPEFARVQVQMEDGTLRAPSRPITIRDLLLHTSGLDHRTSDHYRAANVRDRSQTLPQFIDNIVAVPLMEDPGTRYRYSESPTVVGRLIEIWSGQPFDEFLEEHVFQPLGMIDTAFWVEPGARGRFAEVYRPSEGGRLDPITIEDVPFTEQNALKEGAVGLVSTAIDFLRFSQMLLNGGALGDAEILKPETVAMMTRNGLSDEITQEQRGGRTGWGLGNVSVVLDPEGVGEPASMGEYTWNGSAGTIFWVDPSRNLAIVLMTQTQPTFPDGLRAKFKTAVDGSILPE